MKDTYTRKEVILLEDGITSASINVEAATEILNILEARFEFSIVTPTLDMIADVRAHWSQIGTLLNHVTGILMDTSEMMDCLTVTGDNEEESSAQ